MTPSQPQRECICSYRQEPLNSAMAIGYRPFREVDPDCLIHGDSTANVRAALPRAQKKKDTISSETPYSLSSSLKDTPTAFDDVKGIYPQADSKDTDLEAVLDNLMSGAVKSAVHAGKLDAGKDIESALVKTWRKTANHYLTPLIKEAEVSALKEVKAKVRERYDEYDIGQSHIGDDEIIDGLDQAITIIDRTIASREKHE